MNWNPFKRTPATAPEVPRIVDIRNDPLRRFSREEVEVACISAHMSGRVYSAGGEKLSPYEEHTNMLNRAFADVHAHRRRANKEASATRRASKKATGVTPENLDAILANHQDAIPGDVDAQIERAHLRQMADGASVDRRVKNANTQPTEN